MITYQDFVTVVIVMSCFNMMTVSAGLVFIYCHFEDRLKRMTLSAARTRGRVIRLEEGLKRIQVFNPPTEEVVPPPAEDYNALIDSINAVVIPPEAIPVAEPMMSMYNIYLDAHRQLWKLQVTGDDRTDFAEYLRGVMDESYEKMDPTERENAERDAAESWRHI